MLVFLFIFIFSFHLKEELLTADSVKIFIIDSEVESGFLKSPVLKIQADSSHGSKIAAVIRSQSRSEIRAFSAENIIGRIDKNNYLTALKEAKNYAALHPSEKIVINISLGFEKSEFQQELISEISELENVVLVAAAGNDNSDQISYPARFENVIAAAALENGEKMAASNYGSEIDFAASGIIEITQRHYLPALNYSRKYKLSGTSFAAPQISALIADILALNSELNIEQALKIIRDSSQKLNTPLFEEGKLGAGRINRFKALSQAKTQYFWLQFAIYTSLTAASLLFLYFCWLKYSLSGILIFLVISVLIFLMQPFLLLLYYQFGISKLLLFILSLTAVYGLLLRLLKYYINNSNNFYLMLKAAPYLNQRLQAQLNKRIELSLAQNSKQQQKLRQKIISSLAESYSLKKINYYLKLAAALKKPPVNLIVKKSLNYGIPARKTASDFNLPDKNYKERCFLTAQLLALIFNRDYAEKKKAAEIAAELNSALILIPIKNSLQNRKKLQLQPSTLYFLLDTAAAFGSRAADFSPLLKEIITEESNPWLKFHALQTYCKTGIKDSDYQEFIAEIKLKEKEPVLLALKD
ncbi:MAG: S8 family peptidase [Halanaerobium sp.]